MTPLAYSVSEACNVARTGRTFIYEAIKAGELVARKRGRSTIILADDLQRWLQSLPVTTAPKTQKSTISADQPADVVVA